MPWQWSGLLLMELKLGKERGKTRDEDATVRKGQLRWTDWSKDCRGCSGGTRWDKVEGEEDVIRVGCPKSAMEALRLPVMTEPRLFCSRKNIQNIYHLSIHDRGRNTENWTDSMIGIPEKNRAGFIKEKGFLRLGFTKRITSWQGRL